MRTAAATLMTVGSENAKLRACERHVPFHLRLHARPHSPRETKGNSSGNGSSCANRRIADASDGGGGDSGSNDAADGGIAATATDKTFGHGKRWAAVTWGGGTLHQASETFSRCAHPRVRTRCWSAHAATRYQENSTLVTAPNLRAATSRGDGASDTADGCGSVRRSVFEQFVREKVALVPDEPAAERPKSFCMLDLRQGRKRKPSRRPRTAGPARGRAQSPPPQNARESMIFMELSGRDSAGTGRALPMSKTMQTSNRPFGVGGLYIPCIG